MMKKWIKQASMAAAVSMLATTAGYSGASLKILHFNDHHSYLDESSMKLKIKGIGKVYTPIGGFPRMATMIKKLKDNNTMVLDAGDAFSGTLYHTLFHGMANVEMMNQLKLDAFTLGNHEFDNRDEGLKAFLDKANFPVVSSNVVAKKGTILDGKWTPYIIKEVNGVKYGIIGLEISQKTKVSSRPSDDITFLDEAESTQKYADELKSKGIDKIILLSHFGYENDLAMASKISGVDVIIDGDSHTLMGDFSAVGLKSQVDEYPKQTTDKDGKPVCIAQAWAHSLVLGEVHVTFDDKGEVSKCEGTPHLMLGSKMRKKNKEGKKLDINATLRAQIEKLVGTQENLSLVTGDEEMNKVLNHYKELVDKKKNDSIGTAAEDLKHIRIPGQDYGGVNGAKLSLGSDIAPVVAKGFYEASLRADLCIQNAGGVRVTVKSGDVSFGDAYTLLPFSNTLFEIDMKGSEVKQVLEDAIINFKDNGGSTGSFPYAYGIKYDVDMNKSKNERISNIEVMDRKTKKWGILGMDKTYIVVTNNYIAEGRDGYTTFKTVQKNGAKAIDTYLDYAESFVNYVKGLAKEGKSLTKLPTAEHCIKSYKE
jgi:5'-nucleotidase